MKVWLLALGVETEKIYLPLYVFYRALRTPKGPNILRLTTEALRSETCNSATCRLCSARWGFEVTDLMALEEISNGVEEASSFDVRRARSKRGGIWSPKVREPCSSCLGLVKPADPIQRPTCSDGKSGGSLVNQTCGRTLLLRQVALMQLSILVVTGTNVTILDIGPNSLASQHSLSNSRVKRKLGWKSRPQSPRRHPLSSSPEGFRI